MGPAGLGAVQSGVHQGLGDLEEIPKLQGLHQLGVVGIPLVVNGDVSVAVHELLQDLHLLGQELPGAEDGGVVHHGLLELGPERRHLLLARGVLDALNALAAFAQVLLGELVVVGILGEAGCMDPGAPAKDHQIPQGVGPQAVGPVQAHAGRFPSSVKPGHHRVVLVPDDLAPEGGGNPPHGVVGGGHHRHRLLQGVHPQVDAAELGDVGKLLLDDLRGQVGEVQEHVVLLGAHPPALPHLQVHGPGDHVPGGQVLDGGGVALHEALPRGVPQDAPFPPGPLGEEDAQGVKPRGVELVELHVLERKPLAVEDGLQVPGEGVGVGGHLVDAAKAPRGDDDGLGLEEVQFSRGQLVGHQTLGHPVLNDDIGDVELVVEGDVVLHALLVKGLEDHVPGAVGGVGRPVHRGLAPVLGVAAKSALGDLAVGEPVKGKAHVLQLQDRLDHLLGEDLGGILVGEVVPSLHRVEHVPLPVVLLHVAQGCPYPALGRARVAPGGVKLADHRHIRTFPGRIKGGGKARPACTHHDDLVLVRHTTSPRNRN